MQKFNPDDRYRFVLGAHRQQIGLVMEDGTIWLPVEASDVLDATISGAPLMTVNNSDRTFVPMRWLIDAGMPKAVSEKIVNRIASLMPTAHP